MEHQHGSKGRGGLKSIIHLRPGAKQVSDQSSEHFLRLQEDSQSLIKESRSLINESRNLREKGRQLLEHSKSTLQSSKPFTSKTPKT